jgi:hypothetical protein
MVRQVKQGIMALTVSLVLFGVCSQTIFAAELTVSGTKYFKDNELN